MDARRERPGMRGSHRSPLEPVAKRPDASAPCSSADLQLENDPVDCAKRIVNSVPELRKRAVGRCRLGSEQQRPVGQLMLIEQGAQPPPQLVAHNRTANVLADRKSHLGNCRGIAYDHGQKAAADSGAARRHAAEDAATTKRSRGGSHGEMAGASSQAESRARPLARRAFRTARPPAVAIRARKPCFFALRRAFGWNVRFTETSKMWPQRTPRKTSMHTAQNPKTIAVKGGRVLRLKARSEAVSCRSGVVHRVLPCPPLTSAEIRSSLRGRRSCQPRQ